jgi:small subunit ribosomal protein S17
MDKKKPETEQGKKARSIGVAVTVPTTTCTDKHCPFHGGLKLRGRSFVGKIIRDVMHKSTVIEFPRKFYLKKYERYENRRTRISTHIPSCMTVVKGDTVRIMESRHISKTKNFVAIEVVKK